MSMYGVGLRRRRDSCNMTARHPCAATFVCAAAICLLAASACVSEPRGSDDENSSVSASTLGATTSIAMQAVSNTQGTTARSRFRSNESTVPEGAPILARARVPEGLELIEQVIARTPGYLDLSGPCVAIEYPLKEQLGLLETQRARQYPFPAGLNVERFTIFVLEPSELFGTSDTSYPPEPPVTLDERFYLDVRDGVLVLVQENYRDGVLDETRIHRHGDRLRTELPWPIMDWPVPVPRNCSSLWMRL